MDWLAQRACATSAAETRLLFLDYDSWPLIDLRALEVQLRKHGIITAERSKEGNGAFPHTLFALTTCGMWQSQNLTWGVYDRARALGLKLEVGKARAYKICSTGENAIIDTGAALWSALRSRSGQRGLAALRRINTLDLDPFDYGVYGLEAHCGTDARGACVAPILPVVYHHGRGATKGPSLKRLLVDDAKLAACARTPLARLGDAMGLLARRNFHLHEALVVAPNATVGAAETPTPAAGAFGRVRADCREMRACFTSPLAQRIISRSQIPASSGCAVFDRLCTHRQAPGVDALHTIE